MELLLQKGLKVPLFKLCVTSRKSTIFKFEAISIRRLLGITHLFPHNELAHLPYIGVATNTRAD